MNFLSKRLIRKFPSITPVIIERSYTVSASWVVAIAIVSILVVLYFSKAFTELSFSAKVQTEVLSWEYDYYSDQKNAPEETFVLRLPPGEVRFASFVKEDGGLRMKSKSLEIGNWASIVLKKGAKVQISRIGTGEVEISVSYHDQKQIVDIFDGKTRVDLNKANISYVCSCNVAIDSNDQCQDLLVRLPIVAQKLVIGETIGSYVVPVDGEKHITKSFKTLLSGTLQIADKSWGKGTKYVLAETKLVSGDKFELKVTDDELRKEEKTGERPMVRGSVAWSFDKDSTYFEGLHVVARKSQEAVQINRSGGGHYIFGVTQWEVLSAQPLLQFIWVFFVSLLLVLGTLFSIQDKLSQNSKDKQ